MFFQTIKEKADKWLEKLPSHVEEGEIISALNRLEILDGWSEQPLGLEEEEKTLHVVYAVAPDADVCIISRVGTAAGNDLEEISSKLKDCFELSKRGADSTLSGQYFWLIPAVSSQEAYEIGCLVWHEYLRTKSRDNHPKEEAHRCPYKECKFS